jgi:hypothetical protein
MRTSIQARLTVAAALLLLGVAAQAAPAPKAAGPKKIMRLGNPATSFQKPARAGKDAIQTPDDVRRLVRGKLDDVMTVLGKAAAHEPALSRLTREHLDAAAQQAEITETSFNTGDSIPWMAYRKRKQPEVLWNADGLVWGGRKPFGAFVMKFETVDGFKAQQWTMVVPKPCGNLWVVPGEIIDRTPPPPKVAVTAGSVCLSLPVPVSITLSDILEGDEVTLTADGKLVETFAAQNGTLTKEVRGLAVGSHHVSATVNRRNPVQTAMAGANGTVKPCPPTCSLAPLPAEIRKGKPLALDASGSKVHPELASSVTIRSVTVKATRDGADAGSVELGAPDLKGEYKPEQVGYYSFKAVVTDSVGQTSENDCGAGPVKVTAFPWFAAGYVGKERLVREEFLGGRCAALGGVKLGILPEIGDNTEFEAAVGGKINFRDGDNSSLFFDAAVNRVLSKGFIGAGVSFWDVTKSDTRALAALVHGGIDLDKNGRFAFEVEGRVPFDQFDDLDNNYQFWGGIRIRPQRLK